MSRTTDNPPSSLPRSLPRDIRDFLLSYPDRKPSPPAKSSQNLTFYHNSSPARPSPLGIDDLHANLRGNYDELEGSHSFIQWIFPIREMGMNWSSQPLELHEIEGITGSEEAMERVKRSYDIMLDFYGFSLADSETGRIERKKEPLAPAPGSFRVRYSNLCESWHNYLRITRILKSLSEFGLEHLNAPLLLFFLVEQARGELDENALMRSMDGYWKYCIRDLKEREWVVEKIEKVRGGEEWTEEMYKEALERRKTTGTFVEVVENA